MNLSESQKAIFDGLIRDANAHARSFKSQKYILDEHSLDRLIETKSLSLPSKKEQLLRKLYGLMLTTFSVPSERLSKGLFPALKTRLKILRKLVLKLRSINYYYEHSMLEALKLGRPLQLGQIRSIKMLAEEKPALSRKDMAQLEKSVYYLINRLIHVDKRLLGKYKAEEANVAGKEKSAAKDFEKLLRKQSDILCHMEAKLPPAEHTSQKLLDRAVFSEWSVRLFALLAALLEEHQKEQRIVQQLRKSQKSRRKLDLKISHLIREQWELLRLKEKRLLAMGQLRKIDKEHQTLSHRYAASLHL